MNKLTAEVARQDLNHLKAWVETCRISPKEERYMQALEIALPILEQQERGESWIEWKGGDQPVSDYAFVEVKFRNGLVPNGEIAACYEWNHGDLSTNEVDIIAYRIIPERAINQNGEQ